MKQLRGLWPLAAMLLSATAVVGLIALLLANHILPDILSPTPDSVANNLVEALMAQRFEGVKGTLTQDLKQQVDDQQLKDLQQSIAQAHGDLEHVEGEVQQEDQQSAEVQVTASFGDQTQQQATLSLSRENEEWKVESISPLKSLAQ